MYAGARGLVGLRNVRCFGCSGLWAIKKKHGGKFPVHEKKAVVAKPAAPEPRFYPAEDVKKPLQRRMVRRQTRLRASIVPGAVLILLAGRFKGKRVVFLGQLPSGLLLVTGPFKLNGVPLRRVNQAYVIGTSTRVDVSGVDLAPFTDAYFRPVEKKTRSTRNEEGFFEEAPAKAPLRAEVVENQKAVDAKIMGNLSDELQGYLRARFSLHTGDRPHLMKF